MRERIFSPHRKRALIPRANKDLRSYALILLLLSLSGFPQQAEARPACSAQKAASVLQAEEPALLGLMLGHVSYREAHLWLRTDRPCKMSWELWPLDSPALRKNFHMDIEGGDFFLGTLSATLLKPGTAYQSKVLLNGKEAAGAEISFKTMAVWPFDPNFPSIRLAMGSCTYINEPGYDRPGKPYGADYQIFGHIADQKPDAMLWLGDNTYLREPDYSSKSGIYHRYAHTRATPEMQKLLRSVPNYAIWDDHDFGPNDSDRSYVHKDWALEAFRDFWANPSYGNEDLKGIMSRFNIADLDIILLDNRWYRTANHIKSLEPTILGRDQEDWLIENLKSSKATFKLVLMGGQLLNTAKVWETYANLAPVERQRIIDRIEREGIEGVIFVSGDRHHSEISLLELPSGTVIYDVTVSPLSSGAHRPKEENNSLLLEGSLIEQRNFALMELSGPKGARELKVSFYDSNGHDLFEHIIPQSGFRKE